MQNRSYLLIGLICLFVSFNSCTQDSTIKYIQVEYYNYLFESPVSIGCDEIIKSAIPNFEKTYIYNSENPSVVIDSLINNGGILDTMLRDQIVLKEIEKEIRQLKPSSSKNDMDARISVTIKYKDGKEEKICIGGYYSEEILYKGQIQQKNNRLLFLIKNNIGYYPWISNEELNYMDELKDTTFIREPFIESSYYKQYKKIQNIK